MSRPSHASHQPSQLPRAPNRPSACPGNPKHRLSSDPCVPTPSIMQRSKAVTEHTAPNHMPLPAVVSYQGGTPGSVAWSNQWLEKGDDATGWDKGCY